MEGPIPSSSDSNWVPPLHIENGLDALNTSSSLTQSIDLFLSREYLLLSRTAPSPGPAPSSKFPGSGLGPGPEEGEQQPREGASKAASNLIMFGLVFCASVLGNILVGVTIVVSRRLYTLTNALIFNLCVSDLLIGALASHVDLTFFVSIIYKYNTLLMLIYFH